MIMPRMEMPFAMWRECAIRCIGRVVFAGAVAMFALAVHLHFDPFESLRDAAVVALTLSAALAWKCGEAGHRPPERTFVWRELTEPERPRERLAVAAFSGLMSEIYGRFAFATLVSALALRILAQAHLPPAF